MITIWRLPLVFDSHGGGDFSAHSKTSDEFFPQYVCAILGGPIDLRLKHHVHSLAAALILALEATSCVFVIH